MGCMTKLALCTVFQDISSAGQAYVVAPVAGTVAKVYTVLGGTIATADAVLTVKDGDGNSMGTITIAYSGSAAGDQDNLSPTSNNVVAAGELIEFETSAASTNTIEVSITVEFDPA